MRNLPLMSEFVSRYEHLSTAVNVILDTVAKRLMDKNKKVIIMLCGKQGVPLRGHRDDRVDFGQAETDEVLANHLQSAPRNALYTSKTIQNSLIDVVRQRILRDIVAEVNSKILHYYSR